MNKRSAPRFPVTLDVNVIFPVNGENTCTVRDYCSGGMYLLCEDLNVPSHEAHAGDRITVIFDDPLRASSPRHRVEARIVRVEGRGMGIAFTQQNTGAVDVLSRLASSQSTAASGVAGSVVAEETYGQQTVERLLAHIESKSQEHVSAILSAFFKRAQDALFDAAGEAKSNEQQSAFFGAMNELRKGTEALSRVFLERLSEQFEVLSRPGFRSRYQQEAAAQGGLSLLESDELDNWLAVRAMSTKLEERLGEELEALATRLEEIAANPIKLENTPSGPFVIASIFREILNRMVLEEAPRKLLLSLMEELLADKLKALYDELNQAMVEQGILPTIEKRMEVVKKPSEEVVPGSTSNTLPPDTAATSIPPGSPNFSSASGAEGASATAPATGLSYSRASSAGGTDAVVPQQSNSAQFGDAVAGAESTVAPRHNQVSGANSSAAAAPSANPGPRGAEAPVGEASAEFSYNRSPGSPSNTTSPTAASPGSSHAVHELVRLQPSDATMAGDEAPPPAGYYSNRQLVEALGALDETQLQRGSQSGSSLERVGFLERALKAAAGEEGMALSDGDKETITYVGGMFSAIHTDALVAEQARPWFRQLEVPLLKAGLLDETLQEDETHPARELLNRLEALGDLLQNDDSAAAQGARQRIEEVLAHVSDKVESESGVFVDALTSLEEVQQTVEGNYEENIKKLIQQCEHEKELNNARRTIIDELNHRLGRRDVPLVVLNLLDSGWKNLLLRTLMKSGTESIAFKTYLNVIDCLTARLTGGRTYQADVKMSDEELLEWISRMLKLVSSNAQKNEELLDELGAKLLAGSSEQAETRYVPALTSKTVSHQAKTDAFRPEAISDDIWALMLEDARQLADREFFILKADETDDSQVSLVWRDEERRFVFADNRGEKALDIELGDVAGHLYQKRLVRVNDKELSVTERATYNFLQSLHNQITYQANHDSLTGLFNRKAFTLELEKVVDEAKAGKATHVLGYFDLDRFNLINTTCGHAEGDVLLGKVAAVLRESTGDEAVIARLGGDEFGIILCNTSRSSGLKQLTAIHDSIRDIRFACDNNEFKVTCSMGVTEINEASDTPGRLLSAVDSATFTAKDNGRDNIQIYNLENERISSRRHILDWVGRINVLFEKNLIKLRCQKIAPLHKTINSLPHYEILLDVEDEDGNKVPLDEFIVAAERYDRIIDIDTWVVNYIFDWLEQHKGKLDRISNLSVNLSGSSLGNRHFVDQLHQRMSRQDFPSDKVCFEVTETIAMNDLDASARFMRKLKQTGCRFSLDDFGSGTSSYSYLRSLPIDYIKIDGAFIKDIATNTDDYAVVKSINEIGHVMGKQTVAENVEDDFAYQLLHDIGIDYVQGFGVEKPLPLYQLFS